MWTLVERNSQDPILIDHVYVDVKPGIIVQLTVLRASEFDKLR